MGEMTVPQICARCGNFIGSYPFNFNRAHCEYCGYDGDHLLEFYQFCQNLENGLINNHSSEKLMMAARTELRHGWMPDILAILSVLSLGILTNASYDLIKKWVLSKKEEYEKRYNLFHYEKAVEALLEYMIDNEARIKEFKIGDKEINIKFDCQLFEIKKEIESISENEEQKKT